jgi:hypothetical protein
MTRPESTGLEEVRYLGLGVTLIETAAIKEIPEPWFDFEWGHNEQAGWHIARSEDVYFFDKLREHGVKCYLDHDLSKHVTHLGEFAYTNMMAIPEHELLNYTVGDDDAGC